MTNILKKGSFYRKFTLELVVAMRMRVNVRPVTVAWVVAATLCRCEKQRVYMAYVHVRIRLLLSWQNVHFLLP